MKIFCLISLLILQTSMAVYAQEPQAKAQQIKNDALVALGKGDLLQSMTLAQAYEKYNPNDRSLFKQIATLLQAQAAEHKLKNGFPEEILSFSKLAVELAGENIILKNLIKSSSKNVNQYLAQEKQDEKEQLKKAFTPTQTIWQSPQDDSHILKFESKAQKITTQNFKVTNVGIIANHQGKEHFLLFKAIENIKSQNLGILASIDLGNNRSIESSSAWKRDRLRKTIEHAHQNWVDETWLGAIRMQVTQGGQIDYDIQTTVDGWTAPFDFPVGWRVIKVHCSTPGIKCWQLDGPTWDQVKKEIPLTNSEMFRFRATQKDATLKITLAYPPKGLKAIEGYEYDYQEEK